GVEGNAENDAVPVATDIGPVVIALDADHPAAGELIIAADLYAAERAAAVRTEGLTEDRAGDFLVDPDAADVAADVAAGPAEIDRWRRRSLGGHPQIRCGRGSRDQGGESNAREQKLLHVYPL